MPAYDRAELSAELRVLPSGDAERPESEQVEAVREAAGRTGLAHEGGPEVVLLAGGRREVLEAVREVVEAALEAGAHAVEVRVEAEGDAQRFGG